MKENYSEKKSISIEKFKDVRGLDLSNMDLKNIPMDILMTISFDTETRWPSKDKLPKGFNPEIVLENGKNPGLGLKELHNNGITGKGINVAIIDQKLDVNHKEYFNNIADYKEFGKSKKEPVSMHGPAVASLLVGKNCGVAPEAGLYYKAVSSGDNSNWDEYSRSLNEIIDFNNTREEKDKIKVVSCSNGYPNPAFKGDLDKWIKTIEKAKNSGIILIDGNTFLNLNFIAGGSMTDKEDVDKYKIWLAIDNKIPIFDKINSLWNKKDRIIVPADYRTVASSINGNNGYCFHGRGGISWSIPYLAGLCTLMLQVNKNLKMEEMIKIIHDTIFINREGTKVINPAGMVELSKTFNKGKDSHVE